jgi:hypothetical protein
MAIQTRLRNQNSYFLFWHEVDQVMAISS